MLDHLELSDRCLLIYLAWVVRRAYLCGPFTASDTCSIFFFGFVNAREFVGQRFTVLPDQFKLYIGRICL